MRLDFKLENKQTSEYFARSAIIAMVAVAILGCETDDAVDQSTEIHNIVVSPGTPEDGSIAYVIEHEWNQRSAGYGSRYDLQIFEGDDPILTISNESGLIGIAMPVAGQPESRPFVSFRSEDGTAESTSWLYDVFSAKFIGDLKTDNSQSNSQRPFSFTELMLGGTDSNVLVFGPDDDQAVLKTSCVQVGCPGDDAKTCRLNSACAACLVPLKALHKCMLRCRRCNPRTFCREEYRRMREACTATGISGGGSVVVQ